MNFQLKSLILWARKPGLAPRTISFEPGKVNVITGNARTGKSAIIPIIDYCLCASSSAIPKKVVGVACNWFGLVLETSEGQKLLARRNSSEGRETGEMFMIEGGSVEIPDRIDKGNCVIQQVKEKLDRLSGLSQFDFAGGEASLPSDFRLGFRDLTAFLFQPQNIVANRDILFYRAQRLDYKIKLAKNTLPYVLSIVTPAVLASQHELERLNRDLKRKKRELAKISAASAKWEGEMETYLVRAEELGLHVPASSVKTTPKEMLRMLRNIAQQTVDDFNSDSATISGAIERQIELETEDDEFAGRLSLLRSRQAELARLKDGVGGYRDALFIQRDRLSVSEWLEENSSSSNTCALCGASVAEESKLRKIVGQLREVEKKAGEICEIPFAVDREVQQIRSEIDDLSDQIRSIRAQKKLLAANSDEAKTRQFRALNVALFLGRLQQALSLYDNVGSEGELPREIDGLEARISTLMREIDRKQIDVRKESVIARISHFISQFMPMLDNDHGSNAARLDIEDLTLRIDGAEGQSALWSIGSASNHLSYHVSTLLALHKFFLEERSSPVPGLLILDQPSQVYFPEKIHREGSGSGNEMLWSSDEDIASVRKVFKLIGQMAESAGGRFQSVVLDHAPESVWGGLTAVALAADWHNGEKLIPPDW